MLRVVHVSNSDSGGGAALTCRSIHNQLLLNGIDSHMSTARKYLLDSPGLANRFFQFINISNNQILAKIGQTPRLFFNVWDPVFLSFAIFPSSRSISINSLRPDIVHLHWIQSETLSLRDAARIRAPLVWTLHDSWPFLGAQSHPESLNDLSFSNGYKSSYGHPYSKNRLLLERWVFNRKSRHLGSRIKGVIAPSEWMKSQFLLSGQYTDALIKVIPNPVDLIAYKKRDVFVYPNALELASKKVSGKKLILIVGAYLDEGSGKGIDLLQGIDRALREVHDDVQFVLAGNVSHRLKHVIRNMNWITPGFISTREEMSEIYSVVDIVLLLSPMESFSLAAAEASACSTPVVCIDSGGIRDVIKNNQNGYICKSQKAIVEALRKLLEDSSLVTKFGLIGRRIAEHHWDPDKISLSTLNFYNDVLASSRTRSPIK